MGFMEDYEKETEKIARRVRRFAYLLVWEDRLRLWACIYFVATLIAVVLGTYWKTMSIILALVLMIPSVGFLFFLEYLGDISEEAKRRRESLKRHGISIG
jgi:hypothetical protein